MTRTGQTTGVRVLKAGAGEVLGSIDAARDRFMIEGAETEGRFAMMQYLLPPKALAAPVHMQTHHDEYSLVLQGRVGVCLDDEEVFGEPGDLIFKARGQWQTFWNAGEEPAVIVEVLSPGGFERAFREMHEVGEALDVEGIVTIAERYGCKADLEATERLIERHGLSF